MLESIAGSLMTAEQIKHWTSKDPVLSRVREYVLKGWPDHSDTQEFVPYKTEDSKSSVFRMDVCCGEPVSLFPNRDGQVCWNSYISPTQACPR